MFEPGEPWWMLTPPEIHAGGYGLLEGMKPWKRRVTPYDQVDTLPLSPEWKADIKAKYHYYRTGFEIPETVVIIAVVSYYAITNLPQLMGLAGKAIGMIP